TPIDHEEETALMKRITALLPQVDVVIFEDYDKGSMTPSVIQQVVTMADKLDIPTVVDPKKRNFLDYHGVTLFKPNLKELKDGLMIEFGVMDINQFEDAVALPKSKINIENALIALSERGVFMGCEH